MITHPILFGVAIGMIIMLSIWCLVEWIELKELIKGRMR